MFICAMNFLLFTFLFVGEVDVFLIGKSSCFLCIPLLFWP